MSDLLRAIYLEAAYQLDTDDGASSGAGRAHWLWCMVEAGAQAWGQLMTIRDTFCSLSHEQIREVPVGVFFSELLEKPGIQTNEESMKTHDEVFIEKYREVGRE